MMKIYGWFIKKITTVQTAVANLIEYVTPTFNAFYAFLSTFFNNQDARGFIRGLLLPANPEVLETLVTGEKRNVRGIFSYSLFINICYYLTTVVIYGMAKNFMRQQIPSMKDSYPEMMIDALAYLYFSPLSWRMFAANSILNSAQMKGVYTDNPGAYTPRCRHDRKSILRGGKIPVMRANLISPVYSATTINCIKLLSCTPYVGRYITLPLFIQAYGQNLTECHLSNMCSDDRYQYLAENKTFNFALGLIFMATLEFWNRCLARYSGVRNNYTEDAIFAIVYQYFLIAVLLIDKPLPGGKIAVDVFSIVRNGTDFALQKLAAIINDIMNGPPAAFDMMPWLQAAWDKTKHWFMYEDYTTLDKFVKSPEMKFFWDTRGSDIDYYFNKAQYIRHMKVVRGIKDAVSYMENYIPERIVSPDVVKVLKTALSSDIDPVLNQFRDFIDAARIRTRILVDRSIIDMTSEDYPEPGAENTQDEDNNNAEGNGSQSDASATTNTVIPNQPIEPALALAPAPLSSEIVPFEAPVTTIYSSQSPVTLAIEDFEQDLLLPSDYSSLAKQNLFANTLTNLKQQSVANQKLISRVFKN